MLYAVGRRSVSKSQTVTISLRGKEVEEMLNESKQDARPLDSVPLAVNDARYAYHEAGHAVAAAVLRFPFRSSGIHIDRNGWGTTLIVPPSLGCSSPSSDLQVSQKRMLIVLLAGLVAQKGFFSDSSNNSAASDEKKIQQYLDAIYRMDETSKSMARKHLEERADSLVEKFRDVIEEVAKTLWAKECTTRVENWESRLTLEKTVGATEIAEILRKYNISCRVDDSAIEDDPSKIAD
jgi:hypothetical protein